MTSKLEIIKQRSDINNPISKFTRKKSLVKMDDILFIPSLEQQLIIDAIRKGHNVSVNAVAGSGKTTTILGIASQCSNKKILQITYNRALKLEVEKKVKKHKLSNLKILTYHGLACSHYDYNAYTDDLMQEILRKNKPLNKSVTEIPFDIIIIDEIQDMTPLYFEFIYKFIYDLKRKVQIGIMGDHFQGIYGFKGADERFLTLGDQIFTGYQPLMRLTLNTSYRLTQPIADFVNHVLFGVNDRIKAIKNGVPVVWVQYPYEKVSKYISDLIIHKITTRELLAEDIFILAPSIKNCSAVLIKELENALVSAGILCFVPTSEDAKLDERVIKDKVVFTTIHQSKGRERAFVVVYGFDASYYKIFKEKDIHTTTKICPNLLYVAATRASQQLVIVEHIDLYSALPFLKMTHSQMAESGFIQLQRHNEISPNTNKNIDNIQPLIKNDIHSSHDKSITDLIKFIDEATLSKIGDLISQITTTISLPNISTTADIANDIKTSSRTYEQVSDINGITIPALLFSNHNAKTKVIQSDQISDQISNHHVPMYFNVDSCDNYLWNYLKYKLLQSNKNDRKNDRYNDRNSFIMQYIKKLVDSWRGDISDWLFLGNIFLSANEGYNYKLRQITEYNWLRPEAVAICHSNLAREINIDIVSQCQFEFELGSNYYSGNSFYKFNHNIYNDIKLRGRLDCITPDTIWEFKCVGSLSIEHMIQLSLYAWIWNKMVIETDKLSNEMNDAYDEYLERTYKKTRQEIYQFKRCKIMNIRTGEVRELNTTSPLLNDIVEIILEAKLRIKQPVSDLEFIDNSTARISKYIPIKYSTMEELEAEEYANLPELDF